MSRDDSFRRGVIVEVGGWYRGTNSLGLRISIINQSIRKWYCTVQTADWQQCQRSEDCETLIGSKRRCIKVRSYSLHFSSTPAFGYVCRSSTKPRPCRPFTKITKPLLDIRLDDIVDHRYRQPPCFSFPSCLSAYRDCPKSTWIVLHLYNSLCIVRAQRNISP